MPRSSATQYFVFQAIDGNRHLTFWNARSYWRLVCARCMDVPSRIEQIPESDSKDA